MRAPRQPEARFSAAQVAPVVGAQRPKVQSELKALVAIGALTSRKGKDGITYQWGRGYSLSSVIHAFISEATLPNDKTIIEFGNNIFEMMDYNIQKAIEYVERYKDDMMYGEQTLQFLKSARDSHGIRESISKILKNVLKEGDYSDTYFSTFSGAIQTARSKAESAGYQVDEDDWFREVNVGSGKPKEGQTFKATIGLIKDGKPQRKFLNIQVYNMGIEFGGGNNYELNSYIW